MSKEFRAVSRGYSHVNEKNNVLRQTMMLLSASFLFSSFTAYLSFLNPYPAMQLGMMTLIIYMGLIYLVQAFRNSSMGILMVFALTGFLGYTLGPLLHMVFYKVVNGPSVIATALLGTGTLFAGLSAYATTTKEDFSYLSGFLSVGILTVFALSIFNLLFFQMPFLSLMISCSILLLSSGFILLTLSDIINQGERNYIMATVAIYVQLYNIFVSLLQILSAFSGRDR